MIRVTQLDHLVLTVQDTAATIEFYTRVLGMKHTVFADGCNALHFGNQKINLYQLGQEFEPKAATPTSGSADLCFVMETPIAAAKAHLEALNIEVLEGPVERTGATGTLTSLYIRDPDLNLIELSVYNV